MIMNMDIEKQVPFLLPQPFLLSGGSLLIRADLPTFYLQPYLINSPPPTLFYNGVVMETPISVEAPRL